MKKLNEFLGSYLHFQKQGFSSFKYLAGLITFFVCLNIPGKIKAQQFVKTYIAKALCANATGSLTFHCITKTLKSTHTFYIAGIQDTSVYVAELNTNGVVLQEKLIGIRSKTYILTSMITDDDGNIVIVGYATVTYPYKAFIMKISSALSVLYNKTFNNFDTKSFSSLVFTDIKDNKSVGNYCVRHNIIEAEGVIKVEYEWKKPFQK